MVTQKNLLDIQNEKMRNSNHLKLQEYEQEIERMKLHIQENDYSNGKLKQLQLSLESNLKRSFITRF